MTTPKLPVWNLILRFLLELAALFGISATAWVATPGPLRWVASCGAALIWMTIWGVFNVLGDPSRSGAAPIKISGAARLTIELLLLYGGAAAFYVSSRTWISVILALLITVHYATTWGRIKWLLKQQASR